MKYRGFHCRWLVVFALGSTQLLSSSIKAQDAFRDPTKPLDVRVNDLLSKLTLEEKIGFIHSASKFSTAGVPRLGVPPLWMSDGPHGVREEIGPDSWNPAGRTDDFATAMPVGICLAATWDPEMARLSGLTIGQEALVRGKNIMLGPGVNIMRTPLNGRNFEYLGEDPYLASRMAVGFIEGEQSQGVASCVKHYAGNDQETKRNSIDVQMDDRTLHEIYLPPFKAAIKEAKAWSVMGAYNLFRGVHCCENPFLINQLLKHDWGFQGLVMSDWGGVHSTAGAVNGGLDLEMGTNGRYERNFLANPYIDGLKKGLFSQKALDDKVARVLRVLIATHALDTKPTGSINTRQHQTNARTIAEEGIVLLKNATSLLPLDSGQVHSIAVIGSDANTKFAYGGQSSGIKAFYEVPALEGILRRLGDKATVTYSPGYAIPRRQWRPSAQPRPATPSSDAIRLMDQAVEAAKRADVAIVVAGLNHDYDTEGSDRPDMKLPAGQDELIRRVAAANPKTVVVLVSGSPIELSHWISAVPSVLEAWYGGSEGGNAVARVLFGDVNPSGKLPCTFPIRDEDTPTSHFQSYPGANGIEKYSEGLLVGYRWYDTKNIDPQFPFGFGLSYTRFAYDRLSVKGEDLPTELSFDCSNAGNRDGAEVVQIYVHPVHPKVMRPDQELKAFKKVALIPNEKEAVVLPVEPSWFTYYDPAKEGWVLEPGDYEIRVGSSSRDIRLRTVVHVKQSGVYPD